MQTQIAVLIATKNRCAELANRSLRSVVRQTRAPEFLVVVDDSDRRHQPSNRRIVNSIDLPKTRVVFLLNDRTPGAAGAWNVGLDYLHRLDVNASNLCVAILDDDDEWEPDYLQACESAALETGADIVAADIHRIESSDKQSKTEAPESLDTNRFLVTNPGIQGSNLFVRLSTLLAAGLFDENLLSSTDRDLCIRISDLPDVHYYHLARVLVKHFAEPTRARLSTKGSQEKIQGMNVFWQKYSPRMTAEQKKVALNRAKELFDWVPTPPDSGYSGSSTQSSAPLHENPHAEGPAFSLVVGIIADTKRYDRLGLLLDEITSLAADKRLGGLDIVLLSNGATDEKNNELSELASGLRSRGTGVFLATVERQRTDAMDGLFGQEFERPLGMLSIARARTMVQTYAYLVAKTRPGAVVWILDGDMRLDALYATVSGSLERRVPDLIGHLSRLRTTGVAIAIGTCTESPPVPFSSCLRTQLVDAYHNLEVMAAADPESLWPDRSGHNMNERRRCADYYYDLSRHDTDHLESPFWFVPSKPSRSVREAFIEMVMRLPRIMAGEEVFRPLVAEEGDDPVAHSVPSIHRGGNTFIFQPDTLAEFPNAAPRVAGTETRRSDMVWSLLNRYVAHRSVVKVPIPVRQDRSDETANGLDLKKLTRDVQGFAFYSALEDVLLANSEASRQNVTEPDGHFDPDPAHVAKRMKKFLDERLAALSLSYHRAMGLSKLLGKFAGKSGQVSPWWLHDATCVKSVAALTKFIDDLNAQFTPIGLCELKNGAEEIGVKEVEGVLADLLADIKGRTRLETVPERTKAWLDDQRSRNAFARIAAVTGPRPLRKLGAGAEAIVYTDEITVYKCIDYWKSRMPQARIDFLRGLIGRLDGLPGFCALQEVRESGSAVLIMYPFQPSHPYRGGLGSSMIRLIQSCRRVGIVCTNIHPDNLVVTDNGVTLIDYGSDIRAWEEKLDLQMCRRSFLSIRFASRPDLKLVMKAALTNDDLPELAGFERFLRALEPATKEELLDKRLILLIGELKGHTFLDYGCGKGQVAKALANAGWNVTGYDPDPCLVQKWSNGATGSRFGGDELLNGLLERKEQFDVVLSSLVLCVVNDETLTGVLDNLARFCKPGGIMVVAVCNPRFTHGSTQIQERLTPDGVGPEDTFRFEKVVFSTGSRRWDVHRPLKFYLDAFDHHGFVVDKIIETPAIDPDTLEETSDFAIIQLRRIPAGREDHHE